MDYSLPGSSVHGVFQARVLEWVAIAFSKTHLDKPENIWIYVRAQILIFVITDNCEESLKLTLCTQTVFFLV